MIDEIKAALAELPADYNPALFRFDIDGIIATNAPVWLKHLIARVESLEAKLERTKEHWRRQREETEMIEQAVYDELDEENKELRTKLNVAMEFLKMHLDKQTLPPELASEYLASRKENKG